jgi:prolyl oligopeptidase
LLSALSSLFLLVAAVNAARDSRSSSASTPAGPPKAGVQPVEENFHGTTIVDNYRWLEDGTSPATRKWVEDEMAYTRALLDPLSGREQIHKRLT